MTNQVKDLKKGLKNIAKLMNYTVLVDPEAQFKSEEV